MIRFYGFILLFLAISYPSLHGQKDRAFAEKILSEVKSSDKLMTDIGRYFIDQPYVGGVLDDGEEEQLIVNLRDLDCTTYTESVFALALTVNEGKTDYESFCNNLQKIRYRGGLIDGYCSRLHYSSDWIANNESKELVEAVKTSADKRKTYKLNYMSANPDKYKRIKATPELIGCVRETEKSIENNTYNFIPKTEVRKIGKELKDGDIVFFTTSIEGLDVSHMGIVSVNKKGIVTFLHASTKYKKVIENPESIHDYCASIKKNTGIMVVRPLFQ